MALFAGTIDCAFNGAFRCTFNYGFNLALAAP